MHSNVCSTGWSKKLDCFVPLSCATAQHGQGTQTGTRPSLLNWAISHDPEQFNHMFNDTETAATAEFFLIKTLHGRSHAISQRESLKRDSSCVVASYIMLSATC